MRRTAWILVLIAVCVAMAHASTERENDARLAYSCDNPAAGFKAPCFAPDDPMHMTIAFFSEAPGSGKKWTKTRFRDPGTGVPVRLLESYTNPYGQEWHRVETTDGRHSGWIGSAFVKKAPQENKP